MVVTPTPEEREAWQRLLKPIWTQFEAENGPALIEAAMQANRQAESAKPK